MNIMKPDTKINSLNTVGDYPSHSDRMFFCLFKLINFIEAHALSSVFLRTWGYRLNNNSKFMILTHIFPPSSIMNLTYRLRGAIG